MENTTQELVSVTVPQTPRIGEIWRSAWELFVSRWKVLLPVSLISSVVVWAIGSFLVSLILGFALATSIGLIMGAMSGSGLLLFILAVAGMVILAMILQAIFTAYGQASMLTSIVSTEAGIGRSLLNGFKLLFPLFGLIILQTIVVFGASIIFIIPGIVAALYFIFSLVVVVAEGKRGFDPMLRSYELVRGRWWGVFAHIFLLSLILMVVAIVLNLVSGDSAIVGLILSLIYLFVGVPFALCYAVALYNRLTQNSVVLSIEQRSKVRGIMLGSIAILVVVVVGLVIFGTPYVNRYLSPRADNFNQQNAENVNGPIYENANDLAEQAPVVQ